MKKKRTKTQKAKKGIKAERWKNNQREISSEHSVVLGIVKSSGMITESPKKSYMSSSSRSNILTYFSFFITHFIPLEMIIPLFFRIFF